jgi:hypothetical protein
MIGCEAERNIADRDDFDSVEMLERRPQIAATE